VANVKVTLWRQDVRIRFPVRAADELHAGRSRLFVAVEENGVAGYGEVAPQPQDLNGDAALTDVIDEARIFVVPQLQQILEHEGDLPSWTRVARFAGSRTASNPAVALLEMALLDRELRVARASIDSLWPLRFETPVQQTVSLLDETDWFIDSEAVRARAKIGGGPLSDVHYRQLEELEIPVLLDYNCSARSDADVIEQVRRIRRFADVVGVEQPYAVGNVVDSARLAEQLDVPVSIDEGVRSVRDVGQIVRYHAGAMICVKPARVGGLANARTIIARAQEEGLRAYVGGFFESPYGRRVNRWLANSCVDEPSDLSPVDVVLEGYPREVDAVSDGFGLSPAPEMLERCAVLVAVESAI
jgi:O-succinylbenzoate synthase